MSIEEVTLTDKPTVTITAAKKLDSKIKANLKEANTHTKEFWDMVFEMRNTLGYKQLGYETMSEYLSDRTGEYSLFKISRMNMAKILYDDCHSQRDIAEILGVSQMTVQRDLKELNQDQVNQNVSVIDAESETPDENVIEFPKPKSKGKDGKSYPREKSTPPTKPDPKARSREDTPGEKFLFCAGDGWNQSYRVITGWISGMVDRNPTYEQLEQFEKLLRRTLVKVAKLKEAIEKKSNN